jgi:hypothetical protein
VIYPTRFQERPLALKEIPLSICTPGKVAYTFL